MVLTNFNSTLGNSIKDCIFFTVSQEEGLVQGAPRKELIISRFMKRFKATIL